MAYLIFALVPLIMALLLIMPRIEAWCTRIDPAADLPGVLPEPDLPAGDLPAEAV